MIQSAIQTGGVMETKSRMNIKLRGKIILGYSAPLVLMIAIAVMIYLSELRLIKDFEWEEHTQEAIDYGTNLVKHMVDQETGERGFLITGDEEFLESYIGGKKAFEETIATAKKHVSDNPEQVARLEKIDALPGSGMKR